MKRQIRPGVIGGAARQGIDPVEDSLVIDQAEGKAVGIAGIAAVNFHRKVFSLISVRLLENQDADQDFHGALVGPESPDLVARGGQVIVLMAGNVGKKAPGDHQLLGGVAGERDGVVLLLEPGGG